MQKTDLENKILSKMSKILSAHDVKISYVPGHTNLILSASCEHTYVVWGDLETCLMGAVCSDSLSKWAANQDLNIKNEMTSLVQNLVRSGLPACLADVSSLEEALLRLEISYPDV